MRRLNLNSSPRGSRSVKHVFLPVWDLETSAQGRFPAPFRAGAQTARALGSNVSRLDLPRILLYTAIARGDVLQITAPDGYDFAGERARDT